MNRANRTQGEKGAILVITLMVITILSLLGTTLLTLSLTEGKISLNERDVLQAFYHAEAGIEEAKMRLSPMANVNKITVPKNPSADWRTYITSGQPATLNYVQTIDPDAPKKNSSVLTSVQTAVLWGLVRIAPKTDGSGKVIVDLGGNATLVVTAWGLDGSAQRQLEVELQPIVATRPWVAAIGTKDIKLTKKTCTDSYDSRLGVYGQDGNRGGLKGDIRTDGTKTKSVYLKWPGTEGNGMIKGRVIIGPGGDPNVVVDPKELDKIDPAIPAPKVVAADSLAEPFFPIVPPPPDAQPLSSNKNNNDLNLSKGATRVLTEGVYWVNSMHLTDRARLITKGSVTLFVKKTVKIESSAVLKPEDDAPGNLALYVGAPDVPSDNDDFSDDGYSKGKVQITGDADLHGIITAPDGKVNVTGRGDFFGTIYAKGVKVTGEGCLHYDEALDLVKGTLTGYNKTSWKEITAL